MKSKTVNDKTKKPEFDSKAAFIRSCPETMMARDVVAAAKKHGFTFSEQYVYEVRAVERQRLEKEAARKKAEAAPTPPANTNGGPGLVKTKPAEPQEVEYLAVKLVLAVGHDRAKSMIDEATSRIEHAVHATH